jgi:hypothetical protein
MFATSALFYCVPFTDFICFPVIVDTLLVSFRGLTREHVCAHGRTYVCLYTTAMIHRFFLS